MNKNDGQLGILNEIGDLGLGFDPLSEDDKKKINTNSKREDNKEDR